MKAKGMTREKLAQLAHVSHTTVTMACRGEPIRGDKAAAIAKALGEKPEDVSKQLGHSQVSTTGDIYSHVIEESKVQATECIADIMLRRKRA